MRSACSATAQETKTPTPGNDGVPPKTTRSPAQPSATVSPPETASMTSTPAWETILSKAAGSGTTSRVESAQTSCLAAGAPTSSTVARVRPTAVSHPTVSPAYSVKLAPQEISSCSARVTTTFSPAAETTTLWMVGWAGTTCPAKKATIASSLAASRTSGGEGDDIIFAIDGNGDDIFCGAGDDAVQADAEERVAASCENVLEPSSSLRAGGATPEPEVTINGAPEEFGS